MHDIEFIGGAEKRDVVIVPYDTGWPQKFENHRQRIQLAMGDRALRIDHIGSTSVPGLMAKPIIDIDVCVDNSNDESLYRPSLEDAGYVLRVRERGHRMFRTPELDVHIHIASAGSDWERRHILFRDWLRTDETDRIRYQSLKQELAQQDWETVNHYADAKGELIKEITSNAERWAASTGWKF